MGDEKKINGCKITDRLIEKHNCCSFYSFYTSPTYHFQTPRKGGDKSAQLNFGTAKGNFPKSKKKKKNNCHKYFSEKKNLKIRKKQQKKNNVNQRHPFQSQVGQVGQCQKSHVFKGPKKSRVFASRFKRGVPPPEYGGI